MDNGEILRFYTFSDIEIGFIMDVFGLKNWKQLIKAKIEHIEENGTDYNTRIINIIGQLHQENLGKVQPIKFYFLE